MAHSIDFRHPLGVEPEGNAFLHGIPSAARAPVRVAGLGALASAPDAVVLEILACLDGVSLTRFSGSSKAAYAFACHEHLWRTLVLTRGGGCSEPESPYCSGLEKGSGMSLHKGGWRATFVAAASPKACAPAAHVSARGLFSDMLFKSFLCSTAAIDPRWLLHHNVDVVEAGALSVADFVARYEAPNVPVVITGCASQWDACRRWTPEHLSAVCGDATFDAGGFRFTMAEYFQYAHCVRDDMPLYLFDKAFVAKVPALARDFAVPPYFDADLFSVLGAQRPDYRWLIVGPKRSGSVFHKDPNSTSAWNACISGSKLWIMFPPHMAPPGVHPSADGSEVATSMSPMEWMLDYYKAARAVARREAAAAEAAAGGTQGAASSSSSTERTVGGKCGRGCGGCGGEVLEEEEQPACSSSSKRPCDGLQQQQQRRQRWQQVPMEAVCRAGDVMFVPRGWWHLVLNLEDSVAITQNYVSAASLPHALRFLRDMPPHAVSGVPEDEVASLHARFLAALQEHRPELAAAAVAQLAREDAAAAAEAAAAVPATSAGGSATTAASALLRGPAALPPGAGCAAAPVLSSSWGAVLASKPACADHSAEAVASAPAPGFSFSFAL